MKRQETWSAEDWSALLAERLGCEVRVRYGRSSSYPIQVRPDEAADGRGLVIRMHGVFAEAPVAVREAVASWIRSGRRARRACRALDEWIQGHVDTARPARPARLEQRGRMHDLTRLAAPLLVREFRTDFRPPTQPPALTWGPRRRSRSRRSLRLGSYDVEVGIVRIHPVLDQAAVPEWFVRYILFHELLHAAVPPYRGRGSRWIHHGPEFRRREARYMDFDRAVTWEERNLPRLIASARRGTPLRAELVKHAGARVLGLLQRTLFPL